MPAFTFEKISPPTRRGPVPAIAKKQRGVIVQILDRFVEARVKRSLVDEQGVIARNPAEKTEIALTRKAHHGRRSSRLLQPSIRSCRTSTSPRAR